MGRLAAIVLGAAAGGGFPQWNCRCAVCRLAWAGDKRVKPRTQASLAVSADGEHWILLNASPDLRAQIQANRSLQPRGRQCARQPDRRRGADRRRDRSDRGPAQPARTFAVHALRHRRDLGGNRRQSDVCRARSRRGRAPRRGSGRALCARLWHRGGTLHRARQGAALSRRRRSRHRKRKRRQCRRRDFQRRVAARFCAGRGRHHAGGDAAPGARRRDFLRRHAVHATTR